MGGWNYFEDSPSSRAHWNYGPGDYDQGPDPADYQDSPREQWEEDKARNYPRGSAPPWQGEDAPSDEGWGDIYTDEDTEPPWRDIPDPGFREEARRFVGAATYAESYRASYPR